MAETRRGQDARDRALITYFARVLGASRSGNAAAARAGIAQLNEIEAKLGGEVLLSGAYSPRGER
jgi:hypothetical protein